MFKNCVSRALTITALLLATAAAHALQIVTEEYPPFNYTEDGKLRSFVNVYLNDEDVRYLQKEATTVKDSDNISIVPSIAGGR